MRYFLIFLFFSVQAIEFSWPDVNVGVSHTPDEATGVTVLTFPPRSSSAVDIVGGVPGTVFTPNWLAEGNGMLDAVVLSGGSVLGFGAIHGVTEAIYERRGNPNGWQNIPLVSGAIIYDFPGHGTDSYPSVVQGREAYANAGQSIPTGRYGAGRAATMGKLFSRSKPIHYGQAAKYVQIGDLKILVVTVLNSLGGLIGPDGNYAPGFERYSDMESPDNTVIRPSVANTTITAVVINYKFTPVELKQMARQIHMALGSIIQPFATQFDGDVLYLVSTDEFDSHKFMSPVKVAALAGNTLKDAVWELAKMDTINHSN